MFYIHISVSYYYLACRSEFVGSVFNGLNYYNIINYNEQNVHVKCMQIFFHYVNAHSIIHIIM